MDIDIKIEDFLNTVVVPGIRCYIIVVTRLYVVTLIHKYIQTMSNKLAQNQWYNIVINFGIFYIYVWYVSISPFILYICVCVYITHIESYPYLYLYPVL